MEAVQLDSGMKAILQRFNNAGAEKGFGAVKKVGSDSCQDGKEQQQADPGPFENRVPAPERCVNFRQRIRPPLIIEPRLTRRYFSIRRCRA